jgi:hypothetical protein
MKKVQSNFFAIFSLFLLVFTSNSMFAQRGDGVISTGSADAILRQISFGELKVKNNMLAFPSKASAQKTALILEKADDAYQAEIGASLAELSGEEQEKLNVNYNYVFESFAKQSGFTNSLRAQIVAAEAKLTARGDYEFSEMPSNQGIAMEFLQALVNPQGEVMAGPAIAKFYPNGKAFEILDGDLKALEMLRSVKSTDDIKFSRNVRSDVQAKGGDGCINWRENDGTMSKTTNGTKYRAQCETGIFNWNFFNVHRAWTKVHSQRKGWLFWHNYQTNLSVTLKGSVYASELIPAICEEYVYNDATGQYEWQLVDCSYVLDCRIAESVNQSATAYNSQLKTTYAPGHRIGIPDPSSNTLCGTLTWLGLSKTICLP